jgi:hypothetical protein
VREFGGCRIIHGRADDDATFLTWAAHQATHPWVLLVHPDEQLNPELGRQVQDVTASDPNKDGFRIWRAIYFRGRRLTHGGFQHDSSVRLFRKDAVRFEMRGGQVEPKVLESKIGQLASRLICEARPNGDQPRPSWHSDNSWRRVWPMLNTYVLRLGFLDGRAGLAAAHWSAMGQTRGKSVASQASNGPPTLPLIRRPNARPTALPEARSRRRAA